VSTFSEVFCLCFLALYSTFLMVLIVAPLLRKGKSNTSGQYGPENAMLARQEASADALQGIE
jgi:hypothetical protein